MIASTDLSCPDWSRADFDSGGQCAGRSIRMENLV